MMDPDGSGRIVDEVRCFLSYNDGDYSAPCSALFSASAGTSLARVAGTRDEEMAVALG